MNIIIWTFGVGCYQYTIVSHFWGFLIKPGCLHPASEPVHWSWGQKVKAKQGESSGDAGQEGFCLGLDPLVLDWIEMAFAEHVKRWDLLSSVSGLLALSFIRLS